MRIFCSLAILLLTARMLLRQTGKCMSIKKLLLSSLKTIGQGCLLGIGISIGVAPAVLVYKTNFLVKAAEYVVPSTGDQEIKVEPFALNIPANPHLNIGHYQPIEIPVNYKVHTVANVGAFYQTLNQVTQGGGNAAIVFESGEYQLNKEITIKVPNVMLLSQLNDPKTVILNGRGMRQSGRVENLIKVNATGFLLSGITLQDTGNHLIQIAAENNADLPVIRNCVLRDSYEQMIKVSYDKDKPSSFSDSGLIEYCLFEYSAGIGPNYYIGGLDAHGIRNWVIRNNVFKDIASPTNRIAEHAIHIWNNASNNLVEGNIIIDSDRGIGFGMRKSNRHPNIRYSNYAGVIKHNIIFHSANDDQSADTGVVIEDSPNTVIEGNTIFLAHNYNRAIEYRYPTTNSVTIKDNKTNKAISSRNGGEADLKNNSEDLEFSDFLLLLNLRLEELELTN